MGMNDRMGQGVLGSDAANFFSVELDIADLSADATYFKAVPFNGRAVRAFSVIDGVIATADGTIGLQNAVGTTMKVPGGGAAVITIPLAGTAAGNVNSIPDIVSDNAVLQGAAIRFVVAGAGAGGTPRVHVIVIFEKLG